MGKVRLVILVESEERDAFRKRCKELGVMQAETVRSLLRQWVAVGNGHSLVLPGDVTVLFLRWAEAEGYLPTEPELPVVGGKGGSVSGA